PPSPFVDLPFVEESNPMELPPVAYAVLLGLGLAASTGLNTFLPLLMLAGAAHFQLFGISLNGSFAWLGSDAALIALGIAALVEIVGDKIPAVDHMLDVIGTAARPAAGTLAAASVFQNADPTTAAIAGLIIGAPTAFSFHAAKAGARAASSTTTLGFGNPILSFIEDVVAVFMVLISFFVPWLVPVLLVLVFLVMWKVYKKVRRHLPIKRNAPGATAP
ncbi:MAG TPA: DUF4126 domain-containing protein, partial [Abditibacteriaceae bacterium]|nr:DUF4126 domain-containing protein [Abditibacteriaceae bacterium]